MRPPEADDKPSMVDQAKDYVSVDIEAAGPVPALYSMLSIGACLVIDPKQQFYVEIQPEHDRSDPAALAVSGLSMPVLAATGVPIEEAMARFHAWLQASLDEGRRPVFVAFNAPFDWAFINDAFHRTLGANPFGHAALDIKAYFMGLTGRPWAQTGFKQVADLYMQEPQLAHHALQDAVDQARVFRHMLTDARTQGRSGPAGDRPRRERSND